MIFPIGGDLSIWCSRSVVSAVKRAPVHARFLQNNFHSLPAFMHSAHSSCKRLCVREAWLWEVKLEQTWEACSAFPEVAIPFCASCERINCLKRRLQRRWGSMIGLGNVAIAMERFCVTWNAERPLTRLSDRSVDTVAARFPA